MIIIGKLSEVAVWMLSMPFRVEMVHVQSTSTAAKDTQKGMVRHMPDSAAQRSAFETTFCSGALDGHLAAANRNTRQQQTPHDLPFPSKPAF